MCTPVALLAGDTKDGVAGAMQAVVKSQSGPLVLPQAFLATTIQ